VVRAADDEFGAGRNSKTGPVAVRCVHGGEVDGARL